MLPLEDSAKMGFTINEMPPPIRSNALLVKITFILKMTFYILILEILTFDH